MISACSAAMESAKYHHLSELPEPDYFEIELEKIYGPPPSRLARFRKWARRNVYLVTFVALFLVAAVLYISTKVAAKPRLVGILRPDTSQLKQAALADDSQIPDGLWSAAPPNDQETGDTVVVDVAGSDVNNVDEDDVVLDDSSSNDTNVMVSPSDSDNSQKEEDSKSPIQIHIDPNQGSNAASVSAATPTPSKAPIKPPPAAQPPVATNALSKPTAAPVQNPATPPHSDKPTIQEDTGQVSISSPAAAEDEPPIPIRATFFSSVEGPRSCRGHPVAIIDLPKPAVPNVPSPQQCFNFAGKAQSGCALFMANKADGCVASVYAEADCVTYTNTMAFMPEARPVGGNWRSVMVQCGVPEPDPETLGKPPMMDQMASIKDNGKEKGG